MVLLEIMWVLWLGVKGGMVVKGGKGKERICVRGLGGWWGEGEG